MTFAALSRRVSRLEGPRVAPRPPAEVDAEIDRLKAQIERQEGPEAVAELLAEFEAETQQL